MGDELPCTSAQAFARRRLFPLGIYPFFSFKCFSGNFTRVTFRVRRRVFLLR